MGYFARAARRAVLGNSSRTVRSAAWDQGIENRKIVAGNGFPGN